MSVCIGAEYFSANPFLVGVPLTEEQRIGAAHDRESASAAPGKALATETESIMHCNTSTLAQLGRGALALAALVGAIVLTPHFWPAIGLLAVAFYFMRGCPACWVADLVDTLHSPRDDKPSP